METVLRTENSALILHDLEPEIWELIKVCIETVDGELDVRPKIKFFGRECEQKRSVGFYSDTSKGYNYSTTLTPSKKMHPCLRELLIYINDKFDFSYNGILINKYVGGEEYIGKHSDDERGLDPRVGVVALCYGEKRKFRIRNKVTGEIAVDIPTDSTKIIQMAGDFQKEFTHEIPVEKKVKGTRYSLTFRRHLD
jgi:alkylated DNA repair dioxygenase AlkB